MQFNKLISWYLKRVCGDFGYKRKLRTFKSNFFFKGFWWLSHEVATYFNIYFYIYVDHDYDTGFHLTIMLRSIIDPYGRPVIEVAYGEMIFSLHRGCMRDDSSGRVVGVSAWCIAYVWHIRINISVGSMCIILWFSRYKNLYIYILFSKSICSIKEH